MEIVIFLFFIITYSCTNSQQKQNINNEMCDDSITYRPLVKYAKHPIFATPVSVNGSLEGNFMLDSGTKNNYILIDSAFFFNEINTELLIREDDENEKDDPFWMGEYMGDINIIIGKDTFFLENAEIQVMNCKNIFWPATSSLPIVGIIGATVFIDKTILIDFLNNRFAYINDFVPDTSFTAIQFYPMKGYTFKDSYQRLVSFSGFYDKKGKEKSATFLFDTGNIGSEIAMKTSFARKLRTKDAIEKDDNYIQWKKDSLYIQAHLIEKMQIVYAKPGKFDSMAFMSEADGLLGMPFLKRYDTIVIDYKKICSI